MNTNETPTPQLPEFDPISTPPPLPSPDLTTSDPTAGKPPSMLKGWKNIIPMPDPSSPELQGPMTAGEKNVLKGCGMILAVPIVLLVVWFISRDLLMGLVFLSVAGGIGYAGIKAKRNKLLAIGGAILAAVATLAILDPVIPERGLVSKSDLKNPRLALEKLGWKAFESVKGIESVEAYDIGEGRYTLHVIFHAHSLMSHESTLKNIQFEMGRAYRNVLKYPELNPEFVQFTAQLEMQDRYGNESGWTDVYRTTVTREVIQKLNRERLDGVNFPDIWKVTYVHPIFSSYDRENY